MAIAATTHGYPFPPGTTDYDVYSGDCGKLPNPAGAFNIVQVTTGNITTGPNPCYQIEAHWAGPNRSAYIFMDGLMKPTPTPSCDVNCQSYSYGYTWAQHWVAASHGEGFYPNFFWLDVECPTMPTPGSCTYLNGTPVWDPSTQTSNFAVISGAVAGLRAAGVLAGI
ncbi:MAG: hypothetical protein ACRDWW_06045, partial [Acidimicrobiales bacterium]